MQFPHVSFGQDGAAPPSRRLQLGQRRLYADLPVAKATEVVHELLGRRAAVVHVVGQRRRRRGDVAERSCEGHSALRRTGQDKQERGSEDTHSKPRVVVSAKMSL